MRGRHDVLRAGDAVQRAPLPGRQRRRTGRRLRLVRPAAADPLRQRRRLAPLHRHDRHQSVGETRVTIASKVFFPSQRHVVLFLRTFHRA